MAKKNGLQLRDEIAEILWDELLPTTAQRERDAFDVALDELVTAHILTHAQRLTIERLAGAVAVVQGEDAFVTGLRLGADPARLVCK